MNLHYQLAVNLLSDGGKNLLANQQNATRKGASLPEHARQQIIEKKREEAKQLESGLTLDWKKDADLVVPM